MTSDARVTMDRMYRHQRYIYDLTRKYYLFGRDKLIAELPVQGNDLICEVGCGTARNLVLLAKAPSQREILRRRCLKRDAEDGRSRGGRGRRRQSG